MATTTQISQREPFIQAAGMGITEAGLPLLKTALTPQDYTGREFVADRSQLEKDVATRGAALTYGPDAYQEFMSPYQREVIDATTAALDRQQQQGIASLRQRAQQAGAFGGGREAAMLGEYQAVGDIKRALAEAQLLQQGFQQAQAGALSNLQAQQGFRTISSFIRWSRKSD